MSKIEKLEQRYERFKKELEKSKETLQHQQETVEKKENEVKKAEAELFSTILVENDLTVSDLKNLLSKEQTSTNHLLTNTFDTGGVEDV